METLENAIQLNDFTLNDFTLNEKIKNLAAAERKLTQVIIQHIAEVDRRKLYLRLAYSSLYEYLTLEIGYSEGAAQRRIDAARLLRSVPELGQKIESGTIKLSQISYMQKICRQIKKESGEVVSVEARRNMLNDLENQTSAMTQVIVSKTLNIAAKQDDFLSKNNQADESVRVEFTFSKEQMNLLTQAQALLSNTTRGGLKDTLVYLIENFVQSKSKMAEVSNLKHLDKPSAATVAVKITAVHVDGQQTVPKTLTPKMKAQIKQRDRCCQFVNRATGRTCGSKYFLEVDHIQPQFANGTHSQQNLRMLCRNHNQFRYQAGL